MPPAAQGRPLTLEPDHGPPDRPRRNGTSCAIRRRPTGIPRLCTATSSKGSWRYLEHDWTARAGDYVFEPPGETHTLVVDKGVEEMITFFNVSGCMYYVDAQGQNTGFEDVFTKIDMCRDYYVEAGLGADYIDQFVR